MLCENTIQSRTAAGGSQGLDVSLVLETVLGSTASSINALSAAVDIPSFAFCAGSTAVVAEINSGLRLNQRFFYAKPDALPAQVTPSYYNPATPTKPPGSRAYINTPTKDDSILTIASLDNNIDLCCKGKPSHRSRSLTSVALTPSGKYLAIGEVGYHPRILIFSTAPSASSDTPLACLTEHTYGVQAIAFSHDSRWLCSLGDLHDGGLFLWSINPRTGALKLDSSNRCTTADTMAWMGTNVITVGTRHVKVWRFEQPLSPVKSRRGLDTVHDSSNSSPVPKAFAGRNVLLGPLRDAVFTCVVGISEDAAVLCTQDGAVCLLDDAHRSQRLCHVCRKDYFITCVTLDPSSGVVWIAGKGVEPEALPLELFFAARDPSAAPEQHKSFQAQSQRTGKEAPSICAISFADNRLVANDPSRGMSIYKVGSYPNRDPEASAIQRLPAHNSAVIGVLISSNPNVRAFDFLTYSERGDIFYWSWDGTCTGTCTVPLDVPEAEELNELRIVRHLPTINLLLTGDKTGFLRILDTNGHIEAVVRGHDGEMHDLTVHDIDHDHSLAASSGRDRTIQIFRVSKKECSLEQSLINEHGGPIRQVEFTQNGSVLVSMSSDRTLVLHQRVTRSDDSVAFVSTKTIHLKASPTSMSLLPDMVSSLLLSTMDRYVRRISVIEGITTQSFKTANSPTGESITLSRLAVGTLGRQSGGADVFAGFSSADGSIRIYDVDTGSLLAAVQGQTAVSDLALAQASDADGTTTTRLISTGGSDGTIMIWKLAMPPRDEAKYPAGDNSCNSNLAKLNSPSSMRLVRRVLSKAEIAGFQRSLKEKGDTTSSLPRNLSPSRLGRKPSRYAMSNSPQVPEPNAPSKKRSPELASRKGGHASGFKHASPPLSPKAHLQSRTRRSSLDDRHRHTVTNCAQNIDFSAKQISSGLQHFRKAMANSKEILSPHSAQALQTQLQATLAAVAPLSQCSARRRDEIGSESFEDYLARMIDERLALRSRTQEQANATSGGEDPNV